MAELPELSHLTVDQLRQMHRQLKLNHEVLVHKAGLADTSVAVVAKVSLKQARAIWDAYAGMCVCWHVNGDIDNCTLIIVAFIIAFRVAHLPACMYLTEFACTVPTEIAASTDV